MAIARYVKFFRGTPAAFEKLQQKDIDTLYFIAEPRAATGKLYLGEQLISGGVTGENQLDINLQDLADGDLLVYDEELQQWICKGIAELVNEASPIQIVTVELSGGKTLDDAKAELQGEYHKGDFLIVKDQIGKGHFQITSLIYSGEEWLALNDGFRAENVFITNDFITTNPDGSTQTIPANTSLEELLHKLMKSEEVTVDQPTVEIKNITAGAYEVGTTVQPSWNITFHKGQYSYGPDTGVAVTKYNVTESEGEETGDQDSGIFGDLLVAEDTNYTISAEVTYSDGAVPLNGYGKPQENKQIKSGTVSATSEPITGFRAFFCGTLNSKEAEITSDVIRKLGASKEGLKDSMRFSFTVPVGAMRMIIAYPDTVRELVRVVDKDAGYVDITGCFVKQTLEVNGMNSYTPATYKVYVMDIARPITKENEYIVYV